MFDNRTLEDIQYNLYVIQEIERGLKDAEEGRVYDEEEIEKKMSKWLVNSLDVQILTLPRQ